jgi:hypothetical protein
MDPLAQLSDIHLPDNVHNYPIAPGWWLLAVIVLAILVYGIIKLRQYFKARKVQKQALKQLSTASEISTIVALLKWAALQYFPRAHVAHLTGNKFKDFLIESLPVKHQENFSTLSSDHLNSTYQSNANEHNVDDLSAAAKLWLNQALPPKKTLPVLTGTIYTTEDVALHTKTEVKTKITTEVANNTVEKAPQISEVKS